MKDQLVALLGDKVGLDEAKASEVVDTVVGFLKDNPQRITELLGDNPAEMVSDTLGKLFGR